jgi:hypothetical protein
MTPYISKASLNGHFMGVLCTLNEMTSQQNDDVAKKSRGERGRSFHHGETSPHRFQDVGNRVKCALRHFRVIFIDFPDPVWLAAR